MSDFGPGQRHRRRRGSARTCSRWPSTATAHKTKWVMIVNLNPGGIAGGSAAQYFVGDFDGTRFTADNARRVHAAGR